MKRLCINPITREIAPKYRGQKAVYIAKKDHNSVLLGFEIPKTVDGHDISTDGNIIHIHYANISKDETSVSRGMSEAVNVTVDDEEDIVTFCWRIPNTATRYAGVVSIGVTIERYEDVDGTPQEVYSWSTAPYGNTIVQDSMDNSDEVCEGDFDYLVETCNSIVDLALKDKIADVEADIDAIVERVKGYKDTVETKADEVERYATQTQSDAEAVAMAKDEITTMHSDVSEWAISTKADADRADGYADEVYGYLYGDDDSFKYNNAKYYFEQTKKYAQVNALVGEVAGVGAVRIDDYALFPGVEIKTEVINLIRQEEFFETDKFELKVIAGETYDISCVFKADTNLSGVSIRILKEKENFSLSITTLYPYESTSITIEEGYKYFWRTSGADAKDVYESVSMFCKGASMPEYTSYGKNLINHAAKWEKVGAYWTLDIPVPCDVTISYQRKEVLQDKYYSILRCKPNENGKTDWTSSGGRENIGNIGTPFNGLTNSMNIKKVAGYEYRIFTNVDICNTDGSYKPNSDLIHLQVEVGGTATLYEKYKEPIDGAVAITPTTTLVVKPNACGIASTYKRDINKVIAKLEQAIVNS